ncbi:MAG: histidine phosphatase family protein [Candidatus Wallbacteria bacterium]
MKTIYLIRHGSTLNHENKEVFRGHEDVKLSEAGEAESYKIASYFNGISIDAVFSSPLARARQTAEIITSMQQFKNITVKNELIDINCGSWQGLDITTVKKKYPNLFNIWCVSPDIFKMPRGESVVNVQERAFKFINGIINDDAFESVLIVTHRLLINVIVLAALDIDLKKFWQFRYSPCSVTKLVYDGERFILEQMNSKNY